MLNMNDTMADIAEQADGRFAQSTKTKQTLLASVTPDRVPVLLNYANISERFANTRRSVPFCLVNPRLTGGGDVMFGRF